MFVQNVPILVILFSSAGGWGLFQLAKNKRQGYTLNRSLTQRDKETNNIYGLW